MVSLFPCGATEKQPGRETGKRKRKREKERQEEEEKKRFYPGRIQWPGQKQRPVKARQTESFRYAGHLSPGDF